MVFISFRVWCKKNHIYYFLMFVKIAINSPWIHGNFVRPECPSVEVPEAGMSRQLYTGKSSLWNSCKCPVISHCAAWCWEWPEASWQYPGRYWEQPKCILPSPVHICPFPQLAGHPPLWTKGNEGLVKIFITE